MNRDDQALRRVADGFNDGGWVCIGAGSVYIGDLDRWWPTGVGGVAVGVFLIALAIWLRGPRA